MHKQGTFLDTNKDRLINTAEVYGKEQHEILYYCYEDKGVDPNFCDPRMKVKPVTYETALSWLSE